VRIVVLIKPVPDPETRGEQLRSDGWLDRSGTCVVNGNDEYVLEAALKIADAAPGSVEITVLAMAPANCVESLRKALAMGPQRGVLVTDPALRGSDTLATARVLAAALRGLEYDLVFAGIDTSDGGGGVVPAGIAAILGLPYLSYASQIEPDEVTGTVRVRRLSPTGYDVLEAPMPALVSGTQLLGAPRYPSLRGIMAARSKPLAARSLSDLGIDPATVGAHARTTDLLASRPPAPRPPTQVVRGSAGDGARAIVDFLVERRLIR
jgi:electron transfer flavoprotein beta subunit